MTSAIVTKMLSSAEVQAVSWLRFWVEAGTENDLLVFKITKQQRVFELVKETWALLQFPHLVLEH